MLENRHNNFRLYLTSEQHVNFSNILLEACFKISYESPPGIKKNFIRIYQQLESTGNHLKSNSVFLLAYFHALVQERRTYIPQGWSKSYEFSYSDLKVSMEIIGNLIKEYEQTNNLNLETLYGIFEEGIYGGRIDNPSDLKVLRAYLRKYFNLMVINGQAEVSMGLSIPKNQK
jgi:dynein heavy chain 2